MTTGVLEKDIHKPRILAMTSGGAIALSAPIPTIAAQIGVAADLYVAALTISGSSEEDTLEPTTGETSDSYAVIPPPTLSASSAVSGSLSAEISAPTLTAASNITIGAGIATGIAVPSILAASTYTTGAFATALPVPSLSALTSTTLGSGDLAIPKAKLTATGFSGTLGYGDLVVTVPIPTLSISGWQSTTGTFAGTAPAPTLAIAQSYGVWPCVVINTDTKAVSEYTNYDFIGFANINGVYLALHRNGSIYSLGGDTDAGTDIDAVFETGLDDMGNMTPKRLMGMEIGVRSDGELEYRPKRWNEYGKSVTIPSTNDEVVETRKLATQKSFLSRVFGIEVSNTDGADFSVDSIVLYPQSTVRRSGGA